MAPSQAPKEVSLFIIGHKTPKNKLILNKTIFTRKININVYLCRLITKRVIKIHKNHLNNIGMYPTKEDKQKIFEKHGKSATNTGSAEGQIALFTARIEHLSKHLKTN